MANAIYQLQQGIYRLVARSIYGEEATVSSLSEEELDQFKLTFIVSAGSTKIETQLWKNAVALVDKFVGNMTSIQKLILAAIIAGTILGIPGTQAYFDHEKDKLITQERLAAAQEETKRIELLIDRATVTGEESASAFVKASKGASSVSFGERKFTEQEIKAAQKRAPKTALQWENLSDTFIVSALDCTKQGTFSFTAINTHSRQAIKVSYLAEEDDESVQDVRFALASSLATGKSVNLLLNVGKKDGEIKKVILLELTDKAESQ